jgi:hypothetical protein
VRGGTIPDCGLCGSGVVRSEDEAVAVVTPLLDHHDDDADSAVGQDCTLHRRHLFEAAPRAAPDRLTVGLVQGEAGVLEGESQVRDGCLALTPLRQEGDVGHRPRLIHTSRKRYRHRAGAKATEPAAAITGRRSP